MNQKDEPQILDTRLIPEFIMTSCLEITENINEGYAAFGAGCYWGVEKWFTDKFEYKDALLGYSVGYISTNSDDPENPTYRDVCSK